MSWDELGWDGMRGWDGMSCDGMEGNAVGCDELGREGMSYDGIRWPPKYVSCYGYNL